MNPACWKSRSWASASRNVHLLHEQETRAVGQAPSLVQARRVPVQRGLELGARLRHDFHVGIGDQLLDHMSGALAAVSSAAAHESKEFDEDHFGRDDSEGRQLPGNILGHSMFVAGSR